MSQNYYIFFAIAFSLYVVAALAVIQAITRIRRAFHPAPTETRTQPGEASVQGHTPMPRGLDAALAWSLLAATALYWLPILAITFGLATGAIGSMDTQAPKGEPDAPSPGAVENLRRQAAIPYAMMRLDACRDDLRRLQADLDQSAGMMLRFIAAPQKEPLAFRSYQPLGELYVAARAKASQCLQIDFPENALAVNESQMNTPAPGEPTDNLSQMYRYRKFYLQSSQAKRVLADFLAKIRIRKGMLRNELAE